MTVASISQSFDLKGLRSSSRAFGVIMLAIAIVLGVASYGFWAGHFERPMELDTLPIEMFCTGGALLFFVVGIRAYYSRRFYRVDPLLRTIQWISGGVFGIHYGEEIPFNQLAHVRIAREDRGRSNNKAIRFPVYIHLKSGDQKQLFLWDRYPAARVQGERLAKAANVELHDDSAAGEVQVRTADELDQTIREKLSKELLHRLSPSVPVRMHAKVQQSIDVLLIEVPRFALASLGPMKKAVWGLLAIFGGWVAVALYFREYFVAFVGAIFAGALLYALLRSETIALSRDTLAVSAGVFLFKRTRKIPLSELEELFLDHATKSEDEEADQLLEQGQVTRDIHAAIASIVALGSAIVARSDRVSLTMGRVLPPAELDYLLYQMERWICA